MKMHWHTLDIDKIIELTGTQLHGLTAENALARLEKYGENVLPGKRKKTALQIFMEQFRDFMIVVLIIAAVISGFIGNMVDTIIILVIVFLNALMGFVQQYRAEKSLEALKKMAAPQSTVIRNGYQQLISSVFLVPGDIVLLEAGTLIPADMRLIESHSLRIEESSLTGESVAVDKMSAPLTDPDLPMGDRVNMAYKATLVTNGRGKGIVVATGSDTEIGKIALLLGGEENISPLQLRMADFGKKLSYLILLICLMLFGVGILRGEEPVKMLLISISLAIAAIPEALPALITIALARGAKRLLVNNVLIRKLPAVETLGSVTYVCSDKTGTLTQNRMKVTRVDSWPVNASMLDRFSFLECCMILNNDVVLGQDGNWLGDPTEIALIGHVMNANNREELLELLNQYSRVGELPFDSNRKCMTTLHRYGNRFIAISKGAVESIISLLDSEEFNEKILRDASELSKNGIRVIAYAYRIFDQAYETLNHTEIEKDQQFAGMVGMIDPPREEVRESIRLCRKAGIVPVMITGDHKETATAIAGEIGILHTGDLVVTGRELEQLSPRELDDRVERIKVYARVSPDQKLRIVKSLQSKGHFVCMTGDGVNDAPSLRNADIGVAMGISGTDVSKEASHMILLDDNFSTIIHAVKEGRRIYDNIRKFVKYIMTCNSAELWTIFLAPLIGLPMPLLPVHILWINLITDGMPGLALGNEKAERNIMERPPRPTTESLFSDGIGYHIIWVGLLMTFVTLGTQAFYINNGNEHWQTMVFTVLSLSQLGHVFAIRSDHEFIYSKGIFSNPLLLLTILVTFLLQLCVIYLPFANEIFNTSPLSLYELLACILLSAVVFHAVELEKWIKKRIGKK